VLDEYDAPMASRVRTGDPTKAAAVSSCRSCVRPRSRKPRIPAVVRAFDARCLGVRARNWRPDQRDVRGV